MFNSNLKFKNEVVYCLLGQPVYFEGKNSVAFRETGIFLMIRLISGQRAFYCPPFKMNMFKNVVFYPAHWNYLCQKTVIPPKVDCVLNASYFTCQRQSYNNNSWTMIQIKEKHQKCKIPKNWR